MEHERDQRRQPKMRGPNIATTGARDGQVTPARNSRLQVFLEVDTQRAKGMNSLIRWKITGRPDGEADVYSLKFTDGDCR